MCTHQTWKAISFWNRFWTFLSLEVNWVSMNGVWCIWKHIEVLYYRKPSQRFIRILCLRCFSECVFRYLSLWWGSEILNLYSFTLIILNMVSIAEVWLADSIPLSPLLAPTPCSMKIVKILTSVNLAKKKKKSSW